MIAIKDNPERDRLITAYEAAIASYKKRIIVYRRVGDTDNIERMERLIMREKNSIRKLRMERMKVINSHHD